LAPRILTSISEEEEGKGRTHSVICQYATVDSGINLAAALAHCLASTFPPASSLSDAESTVTVDKPELALLGVALPEPEILGRMAGGVDNGGEGEDVRGLVD
jgi:hypothetical protein